jgi:hypothetical protein
MERYTIIEKEKGVKVISYFSEHWYSIPGVERQLKSVSMVLDVISKGYGFNQWLKDTGHNADLIVERAKDNGSRLHRAFEEAIKGKTVSCQNGVDVFPKREWQKFLNWANWYGGLNITPYLLETTVFDTADDCAGTFDGLFEIKNTDKGEYDGVWLLDWKTGNDIYETSKLQIAAYFHWYNKLVDEGYFSTPKATRAGIVHVGANIKTQKGLQNIGVKVEEAEPAADYVTFQEALALFERFNPDIKAPAQDFPLELKLNRGVLLT